MMKAKFKESIWSIHPKWRGWFYGTLSICGFGVSIFTVWTLCGREPSESWIDIFDAVWNGIVGSVVVVWFVFQAVDWTFNNIINKIMAWGDPARERLRDEGRKEERERARKEAEEYQKRKNEHLERLGVDPKIIQQADNLSSGIGPFIPLTK